MQQADKRAYIYETKTFEEVVTVDVTTTVFLGPGETPPSSQHYGHSHHHKSKVTSSVDYTVTVPAASPSSPPEASAASWEATSQAAPTTSAYVAPTSQAPPPPPKQSSSPPSSGGGAPSGETYHGDITYYTPGVGSCGYTSTDSDPIVALAQGMMTEAMNASGDLNPNHNPLCGKMITISYGGKTAQAKIVDTCPGCSGASLDLSPSLFQTFAELGAGRISGVSWSYN